MTLSDENPLRHSTPDGTVVFKDNHRPMLPDGDFEIHVKQSLVANGRAPEGDEQPIPPGITTEFVAPARYFSVAGPRFVIPADLIQSQFPPQGSLGAYDNVLAHINFRRSSVPWERFARFPKDQSAQDDAITTKMLQTPWMALLLFDEDELPDSSGKDMQTGQAPHLGAEGHRISTPLTVALKQGPTGKNWILTPDAPSNVASPEFDHEMSQEKGLQLTCIDVPSALLADILPALDEVRLLGHVRGAADKTGHALGEEVATLICNRLPRRGRRSAVHLVSLEGFYGPDGASLWELPKGKDHVRLVSLASWQFTCLDPKHSFKGLLHHLNKEHLFTTQSVPVDPTNPEHPSSDLKNAFKAIDLPLSDVASIHSAAPTWVVHDTDRHCRYLLRHLESSDGALGTLHVFRNQEHLIDLPMPVMSNTPDTDIMTAFREAGDAAAPKVVVSATAQIETLPVTRWRVSDPKGPGYWVQLSDDGYDVHKALSHALALPSENLHAAHGMIEDGHVGLLHEMRGGDQSISWYRGACAPGQVTSTDTEPQRPRSSDALLRYDRDMGMFNTSYAAAWELGRLLTLQNQKVAVSLLNWKRQHHLTTQRQAAQTNLEHLPILGRAVNGQDELPKDVSDWFADLALLRGLPFHYLVSDEDMLPPESLRFFQVDPHWIRSLHDGAFSIGRVTQADNARDSAHVAHRLPKPSGLVSGVLLRSELVSGWPDLIVEAYDRAVPHENYEMALQSPGGNVRATPFQDHGLLEALESGDGAYVGKCFGIDPKADIEVSTVLPARRWLLNVDNNADLFRIDHDTSGFRLWIENQLPSLRISQLSPTVLLCLFAGDLKTLDIHQTPQALHFGFSHEGSNDAVRYFRELKSHKGTEIPGCDIDLPKARTATRAQRRTVAVSQLVLDLQDRFKTVSEARLDDIARNAMGEDADAIARFKLGFRRAGHQPFRSSQLALQLSEGVEKVRFVAGTPGEV